MSLSDGKKYINFSSIHDNNIGADPKLITNNIGFRLLSVFVINLVNIYTDVPNTIYVKIIKKKVLTNYYPFYIM